MQVKNEIKVKLGKTLKKWMDAQKINPEELSRQTGIPPVSSSFIKNITYGKALNCSVKYWRRILKPLGKTYDDLLIASVLDYFDEISHQKSSK